MADKAGGLFSTQKVTISKDTQDLMKVLMEESKLNSYQQRKLKENIKSGKTLPLSCPPSGQVKRSQVSNSSAKSTPTKLSTRRTKDSIDQLKAETEVDQYQPPLNKYNSSQEKTKLQNIMTFGEEAAPSPKKATVGNDDVKEPQMDRFDEVLKEIQEREDFLKDMEVLGKADLYRNKIQTEISQKIRELVVIDKKRSQQLNLLTQKS